MYELPFASIWFKKFGAGFCIDPVQITKLSFLAFTQTVTIAVGHFFKV